MTPAPPGGGSPSPEGAAARAPEGAIEPAPEGAGQSATGCAREGATAAQWQTWAALVQAALGADGRGWDAEALASLSAAPGAMLVSAPEPRDGFALLRVVAGEAEVLLITIAAARRRQGLGRALLVRAEAAARGAGAGRMFLEVAADNLAARAFYAQAGYRAVGQRRGYYVRTGGAAVDALLLARDLDSTGVSPSVPTAAPGGTAVGTEGD